MPETGSPSVMKSADTTESVTFTLSNDPPFADDAVWKVYTEAEGGSPAATVSAFSSGGTLTLTTVSLPATTPTLLGSAMFYNTYNSNNAGATLTIRVPSGKVSAYTSGWGVSADTEANGSTNKYGSNHKRIVITDQE
jgi:hypothetical protein